MSSDQQHMAFHVAIERAFNHVRYTNGSQETTSASLILLTSDVFKVIRIKKLGNTLLVQQGYNN